MIRYLLLLLLSSSSSFFFQRPRTSTDWLRLAEGFSTRWNSPHCIGSIDGKHIHIVAPDEGGSMYFNYKGFHSIVALAVADDNYNFIYLDIGCQGRISDRGVFYYSSLYNDLIDGQLDLPQLAPLSGR